MLSSASLIGAVVSAVLALGPVSAPTKGTDRADEPSHPVMRIALTTSTGSPTELASAGLDKLPLSSGQASGRPLNPLNLWLSAQNDAKKSSAATPSAKEGRKETFSTKERATQSPSSTQGVEGESSSHSPLSSSPDALIKDTKVLTEPLEVSDFFVAGFIWDDTAASTDERTFLIRVREGQTWSDWYEIERDSDTRPDDAQEATGTEPFVTAGATGVQILVAGAEEMPKNLELVLVPENAEGEKILEKSEIETTNASGTPLNEPLDQSKNEKLTEALSGASDASSSSGQTASPLENASAQGTGMSAASDPATPVLEPSWGAPKPTGRGIGAKSSAFVRSLFPATTTANGLPIPVVTRSEWGGSASEPYDWGAEYSYAPFVVVHHTAGTNNYTCSQSHSIVRGIYQYHAYSLDWGDIGYNFLVDKCGQAFEGRWGSLNSSGGNMVAAGHSLGFNTGTMGISMLGNYTSVAPSNETLSSVGALAGWHLDKAGVSPSSSGVYVSRGNGKYPKGTAVTLPRISGHRDNGYTACPGDAAYPLLWRVRQAALEVSSSAIEGTPAAPIAVTGQWVSDGGTWYFRTSSSNSYVSNTWALIDNEVYFFDWSGRMLTGWYAFRGNWYYLDPSGALHKGELSIQSGTYMLDESTGAMFTGWKLEGAGWRYYKPDGARAYGWAAVGSNWYYLDPASGIMQTGRLTIAGKTYLLYSSGEMASGWVKDESGWRYYGADGAQVGGWAKVEGEWYYLDPQTGLMKSGRLSINGVTYFLAGNGPLQYGWYAHNGNWFYLHPSDGAMLTTWVAVNGTWYYMEPDSGQMRTGWLQLGDVWYYLDGSGAMRTGWLQLGNRWYYLDASGAMRTGWLLLGNTWYYLDSSGAMVTGTQSIDGVSYFFTASGALR